jgi:hypothetical protein
MHDSAGVVCDRGLTLGDLIGVLNEFFARLGMLPLHCVITVVCDIYRSLLCSLSRCVIRPSLQYCVTPHYINIYFVKMHFFLPSTLQFGDCRN